VTRYFCQTRRKLRDNFTYFARHYRTVWNGNILSKI